MSIISLVTWTGLGFYIPEVLLELYKLITGSRRFERIETVVTLISLGLFCYGTASEIMGLHAFSSTFVAVLGWICYSEAGMFIGRRYVIYRTLDNAVLELPIFLCLLGFFLVLISKLS
jgi:hypothetical protein